MPVQRQRGPRGLETVRGGLGLLADDLFAGSLERGLERAARLRHRLVVLLLGRLAALLLGLARLGLEHLLKQKEDTHN